MSGQKISVEVAYAMPQQQALIKLDVFEGTTVYDAVVQSGIASQFEQIDIDSDNMGIFGKAVKNPKEHPLRDGDRVEIYRPLIIDPKQARLNRAKKKA